MSENLINNKITAPRLHGNIVHRDRLTSLVHENIEKSLIIVCGPAGYGKTTLILDYLSQQKNKYAWLSIPRKGIDDISTFYEYIIGALKTQNVDFGKSTLEVIKQYSIYNKTSKELASAYTESFVNEFQKYFKEEFIFVIDDLHYLEANKSQTWLRELFNDQFENIPNNLHVIVSARSMPGFNLTQLISKRNVLIIDEAALSFRKDEITSLLKKVYKFEYKKNDIELLDLVLKGWITGIHLLLQAYGEDFNKIKYTGEIDLNLIYDFFAQEIFNNLSPELQEFLKVTSILENFDIELANAVLGIENSKHIIEELIQINLFINKVHTNIGGKVVYTYSYHSLFRDFLQGKLQSSKITFEINKLIEKIGDCYVNSGDQVSAINYFIEAGVYDKAATLITSVFHNFYESGKYDSLWRWINLVPENIINNNAELLYELSYLYLYTNTDYEKSLHYANIAIKLFKLDNDEKGLMKSSFVKTQILQFTGKSLQAISEMEKLLSSCHNPRNVFRIYNHLTLLYCLSNKFREAGVTLEKARKYCEDYNLDEHIKKQLNYTYGIFYYNTHEYEKALLHFKKDFENRKILYNRINSVCNIASTYNEMGDYSNSIKYYEKAFEFMQNSNSIEQLVHLTSQKALLLQRLGDFEESTKLLMSVYHHAEKNNSLVYLWIYTSYLFMNYYLSDDRANSLKYLDLNRYFTKALGDEHNKKIYQAREALYSMKFEQNQSQEEKLVDSYSYFRLIEHEFKKTVLFWLAEYYLTMNKPERAMENLKLFLNEASIHANDLICSRNLIDFALSRPELSPYKDKVHHSFAEFFDRLNIDGTSDEYKRKMKIEIEKLYDIRMTSFGIPEFVTRGKIVPDSAWRKKRGKSILAFMMLNPKSKYSKDKLIEMFFYDLKSDTVEDSFKQAVFCIRSVFKNPYLNFLILEDKTLYLNPDCYFKSDAEEFNNNYRIANTAGKSCKERVQACIDAIEIYKGEFMEGNYEPWCEDIRDNFYNKFISISELLLHLLRLNGSHEKIIYYSENLLKHDELNETAYLSLVEAYVRSDKKRLAKENYAKMLKIYHEDLGEKPDRIILNKINSLLNSNNDN